MDRFSPQARAYIARTAAQIRELEEMEFEAARRNDKPAYRAARRGIRAIREGALAGLDRNK